MEPRSGIVEAETNCCSGILIAGTIAVGKVPYKVSLDVVLRLRLAPRSLFLWALDLPRCSSCQEDTEMIALEVQHRSIIPLVSRISNSTRLTSQTNLWISEVAIYFVVQALENCLANSSLCA
jgi:hypothetical protein